MTTSRYRPISPERLVTELTQHITESHPPSQGRPVLAALDGPRCAGMAELAERLAAHLRGTGTPTVIVWSENFYRDASVRLEYGRTDVDSYYEGWLDDAALTREVLEPVLRGDSFITALRDPVTNRSIRGERTSMESGVVLVTGEFLLREGKHVDYRNFDYRIHAALTRPVRRRLTADQWLWTLPALDRYDAEATPTDRADAVLRYNDPVHPALLTK